MKRAFNAIFFTAALLTLSSCDVIIGAILNSHAPTGVEASDGEYADRVVVDWNAPSFSEEDEATHTVTGYTVSWSGAVTGSVSTTSTSYTIGGMNIGDRALAVYVTVTAHIDVSGGSGETASNSDEGFALQSRDLVWNPSWTTAALPNDSGSDAGYDGDTWFVTMLQKGFQYHFDTGTDGDTISFYDYESVDSPVDSVATASGGLATWTCDDNGNGHKFYVRVHSASGIMDCTYSY